MIRNIRKLYADSNRMVVGSGSIRKAWLMIYDIVLILYSVCMYLWMWKGDVDSWIKYIFLSIGPWNNVGKVNIATEAIDMEVT